MTTTTDQPSWAVFDITETANFQGIVQIDPARWETLYGERFDPNTATIDQVRQYVTETNGEVHERLGNIDSQTWANLSIRSADK